MGIAGTKGVSTEVTVGQLGREYKKGREVYRSEREGASGSKVGLVECGIDGRWRQWGKKRGMIKRDAVIT